MPKFTVIEHHRLSDGCFAEVMRFGNRYYFWRTNNDSLPPEQSPLGTIGTAYALLAACLKADVMEE